MLSTIIIILNNGLIYDARALAMQMCIAVLTIMVIVPVCPKLTKLLLVFTII